MDKILDLVTREWTVFLLVLFRVTGVMMFAPVFGSAMAPAAVKIFFSLVLALLFAPLLGSPGAPLAMDTTVLALGVLWELAVGILIGFAAALLFAGVQFGGHLIDQEL